MTQLRIFVTKNWLEVIFLLTACVVWLFVVFAVPNAHVDEKVHSRQIHHFLIGKYAILSNLTTIPGYHVVMAFLAKLTGLDDLQGLRLMSLILCSVSIFIFFLIAKEFQAENPLLKTVQFAFFPLSFVYFPLLYTDIFSLLLLLTAFYFSIKKKYWLAALFSLFSLLVRQNNIVWIIFFWMYSYIQENQYMITFDKIIFYCRRTAGYIIVFMAFILFLIINHGVAVGDKVMQQAGFYRGNLYFFLVVAGILFWPTFFTNTKKYLFKKSSIIGFSVGFAIALSFVFFIPELHKYNLKIYFLKNLLLFLAYQKYVWLYASMILLGYLAIFQMKLEKKSYILFPFIVAELIPPMFMDERYYIVPFVFILLFRKELSKKAEMFLIFYFILLSFLYAYSLYFNHF